MIRSRGDDRQLRPGTSHSPSLRRSQRGAGLLAAAVGVFVLGVGVAIAVPLVQNSIRRTRATEVADALREFAQAFESHGRKEGLWPPATRKPGDIPAGMESVLDPKWSRSTATGLRYLWAPDSLQRGHRYRALIVLWSDKPATGEGVRRLFAEIDQQLDDGDLLKGRFQLGYRDQPFLVIEP